MTEQEMQEIDADVERVIENAVQKERERIIKVINKMDGYTDDYLIDRIQRQDVIELINKLD